MSNLTLQYSRVGKNSPDAMWNKLISDNDRGHNSSGLNKDDLNLNQSIFKSYLDSLRTRSDEQSQKILKKLENSPAETVSRLFGDLQLTTTESVGKLFDGLKLDSADQLEDLLKTLQTKGTDKTDKTDKTDDTDKTDKSGTEDKAQSPLQKYIKQSTEKLSKENTALNENAAHVSVSAQRVQDAFEPDEETGEIDTENAYNAANDFVKSYNSLADAIKGAKSGAVSGKAQFIADMLDAYSRKLDKVGITRDENGQLTVDKTKLETSTERERDEVFGKKDSFAEFIDAQAKQLAAYAQTDLYQRSSAYTDAGNITQVSNINGSYFNMLG